MSPIFINEMFWTFLIWKVHTNYFLKMCPIFVSSLNDFGRSDNDIIEWQKLLFPLIAYVVSYPTRTNISWMMQLLPSELSFRIVFILIRITFLVVVSVLSSLKLVGNLNYWSLSINENLNHSYRLLCWLLYVVVLARLDFV